MLLDARRQGLHESLPFSLEDVVTSLTVPGSQLLGVIQPREQFWG